MRFLTQVSQIIDPVAAVSSLISSLDRPHLRGVFFYYTEEYAPEILWKELTRQLPGVPIVGCSSYQGIMTEKGYFNGPTVALMAVHHDACTFGTGFAEFANHATINDAVQQAIFQALQHAQRYGEVPDLVVLHAIPGYEEEIIAAIDAVFGMSVPIIGGSAADNFIQQRWSVMTDKGWSGNAIAVQLCFSLSPVTTGFCAGYSPTECVGTITKSHGRLLEEIDDEPAIDVYKAWISDHSNRLISDEYIYQHITSFPLGRIAGQIYDQPYYKLTHPRRITERGGLELFADVQIGEEITLMTGSQEQLVHRAARVLKEASAKNHTHSESLGAISIFCAGAMARLGSDIQRVQKQMCEQLNHKPFICPFTYGEQGQFVGGENAHGNLMISSAILYEPESFSL
ncbi:FIST N domain protein [Vibrio ruber DSM 16370]|uniref:FIST N domain protein n=1 Tax=Vibrio ruber (strain DSM 16370 / JCM 11486 / BCRC 17186 / CECT 7878 / LMG 23124 / VR1) TaxID=1123498 RepID=A0A1R4LIK2_VIBR1|nr:FIST N-terminal domain-containing protein [Vibrio ruber]SJN56338.1 FIST N domain protein [Vibrio ruber DSM 16370]